MGTGRALSLPLCLRYAIEVEKLAGRCGICNRERSAEEYAATTRCNHTFCYNCLVDWLENHASTCPLCRQSLYCGPPMGRPCVIPEWEKELDRSVDLARTDESLRNAVTRMIREFVPTCTASESKRAYNRAVNDIVLHHVINNGQAAIDKSCLIAHVVAMGLLIHDSAWTHLSERQQNHWKFILRTTVIVVAEDMDGMTGFRKDLQAVLKHFMLARLKRPENMLYLHNPYVTGHERRWFDYQVFDGDYWVALDIQAWMMENFLQHIVSMALPPLRFLLPPPLPPLPPRNFEEEVMI